MLSDDATTNAYAFQVSFNNPLKGIFGFITHLFEKSQLPIKLFLNGGILIPFNRIKIYFREKSQRE